MRYSTLNELITYLEYGTSLEINALFFGDFGTGGLLTHRTPTLYGTLDSTTDADNSHSMSRAELISRAVRLGGTYAVYRDGAEEYAYPIEYKGRCVGVVLIGGDLAADDTGEPLSSEDKYLRLSVLISDYIVMIYESDLRTSGEKYNALGYNIKRYIDANLDTDIEMSRLAELFSYNEKYLGRFFKASFGIGFKEYINKSRMERAMSLLSGGGYSIIKISSMVGYNNVNYFNRVFKDFFGKAPSEFREKSKILR